MTTPAHVGNKENAMSDTYTCDACGKPHPVGMHCNHYVKAISDRHDAEVDRLCQERDGHCDAEVAADAELTTLRAQVAGLEERVRLLTTAIAQVGIIPKGTPERMKAAGLEYDAKFVERALIDCERAYAASAVKEPA